MGVYSFPHPNLISALDSPEWVILRAIWTVSLVENLSVNIRDFQWKTFTPMQLNMDGWGSNPKYPQALGEPATSINRSYLKLKSMLLPYTYSCAHEAVTGKPLMRAMFLDDSTSTPMAVLHATNICTVHHSLLHPSIRTPRPIKRATTCAMASIYRREHGTTTSQGLPTKEVAY